MAQRLVADGDKDADKQLSKQELSAVVGQWFDELDSVKAGKLTQDQLTAGLRKLFPPNSGQSTASDSGGAPGRAVTPEVLGPVLLSATDANADKTVSRAEFVDAFSNWFETWDANKSGKVTEEQVRRGLETSLPRTVAGRAAAEVPSPRPATEASSRGTSAATETAGVKPRERAAEGPPVVNKETRSLRGATQDYAAFKSIADRNIFDTNRRARSRAGAGEEGKPKRVDTITLVGTLVSEKGQFAFFDGSSSEFRAVLGPGKRIANYEVADVTGNDVTLKGGTNTVHLRVGMQLRREEEGDWNVIGGSAPDASSSKSSGSESSADDDNDIVKRLMRQREQELK